MSNWILGLTGGIGAGKTAVSNGLFEKGICIVDADIIAREVVAPNSEGLNAIIERFGHSILLEDQTLNRAALREIIFSNESQKTWLNALLHPMIRHEIIKQLEEANSTYAVLSAPLLFENGLEVLCDHTLLVDVSKELQIIRTTHRDNVDQAHVEQIIAAQMSRQDKLLKADSVIDNSGTLAQMHVSLERLHQEFIIKAQCKSA